MGKRKPVVAAPKLVEERKGRNGKEDKAQEQTEQHRTRAVSGFTTRRAKGIMEEEEVDENFNNVSNTQAQKNRTREVVAKSFLSCLADLELDERYVKIRDEVRRAAAELDERTLVTSPSRPFKGNEMEKKEEQTNATMEDRRAMALMDRELIDYMSTNYKCPQCKNYETMSASQYAKFLMKQYGELRRAGKKAASWVPYPMDNWWPCACGRMKNLDTPVEKGKRDVGTSTVEKAAKNGN